MCNTLVSAHSPKKAMNIVFIGGGNMASALIGGLLAQGQDVDHIGVVEINAEARARLTQQHGVRTYEAIAAESVRDAEVILLAVKPQQMGVAARALAPFITGQLVV